YFRSPIIPDGAYRVEQTTFKDGYVPHVDSVSHIFDGAAIGFSETVRDIMENQPLLGHIVVRVVDTDGNPIAGATLKATAANVAGPRIPTPPFTQTGILTMEADGSYSLTTGADGSVVIPNLMGNTSTTITQLTTIDGYQIDTTVRVGQITGTNTTATVTFVDPRIPAPTPAPDPTPAPEPQPEPTPAPEPQPETPKAKKVKKSVLPNTGDNALTLPLIIGVAGATVVVAGAALFLHKKRQ
ncbi:MAG: LPXTG cell wall anchor domain-containing protein, partial [Atopobium sp.]|nr:LPXTG cell wall anchor domain-containing protein [Atopobium sp.]